MKRTLFNALIMMLLITPPTTCIIAQNDAYFYDNYDIDNRNSTTGYSFDNFYNGVGLGFGIFNDNLNGFNFGNFGDDEEGLDFGDFDFEGDDVPLDGGLLLLCGFAMLRLKSKDKRLKGIN